ncbi:MAG: nickel pincer cofactor biosynthesis protein LarC [Chloroflexota bacterium]|nr:nickel pincer cofactor biosynthesis protein LarC [Chloroflexota bacterium]
MKIGYLDCISGVSGDMLLGALIDCGLPIDRLAAEIDKLHLSGCGISALPDKRGAINGTRVTVSTGGDRSRRTLRDIIDIISKSDLDAAVKKSSVSIFERLAEAEAKVHCIPIEDVHFHEVGAVDAIVDIVGAVIGFELLGIERLFCSPLPSGGGAAQCTHGTIPVPAPAVLELIASSAAPLRPTPERNVELVTPTGAAIVTTLASFERPTMALERVGYGIGARDSEAIPNVLALWLGNLIENERGMLLIETNIDDMSPEVCGYAMERLFAAGAADVWFTPIQMKKDRPATMLSVLAHPEYEAAIVDTLLRETSTMGMRVRSVERHHAVRETVNFDSSLGRIDLKIKRFRGEIAGIHPEYEDCKRIAIERGIPLQEVYRIVIAEAGTKQIDDI